MTHSTVLVIGEDPETMLAPFDENLDDCATPRWDWYILGGRWINFFTLKAGEMGRNGETGANVEDTPLLTHADQCRKRQIDWEAMRASHHADAHAEILQVLAAVDGIDLESWRTWEQVREGIDINDAREIYHAQPLVKALGQLMPWGMDPVQCYHLLGDPERDYPAHEAIARTLPHALLTAEGWNEKAHLGWFGVELTDPREDWTEIATKVIDAAPDDSLFSLYDIHI